MSLLLGKSSRTLPVAKNRGLLLILLLSSDFTMFSRKVNWRAYVPAFLTSPFAVVIMMKVIGVWNLKENSRNKTSLNYSRKLVFLCTLLLIIISVSSTFFSYPFVDNIN
jgi:hypothetical protein